MHSGYHITDQRGTASWQSHLPFKYLKEQWLPRRSSESLKLTLCQILGRAMSPEAELERLEQQLEEAYWQTAAHLPTNTALQIEQQNGEEVLKLDERPTQGQLVRPEDVERLSPLRFQHINVHGTYHFTLPETVAQGHRRPLRPLSSSSEELF